jgi:glutamine amidotransferase-like uncharacterized protein
MPFILCMILLSQTTTQLTSSSDKFTVLSTGDPTVIRVAIYVGDGDELWVSNIFNYQWTVNGQVFMFQPTIIYAEDVIGSGPNPLTRDRFDVLLIGASARSYLVHGVSSLWKEKIRSFVSEGGGYIGLCAGAILASCGFEHPTSSFHNLVNHNMLEIANVNINDEFFGELQYVLKNGFSMDQWVQTENKTLGYVDINTSVVSTDENVIFSCYDQPYRHLTYAGGPGFLPACRTDPVYGNITPLLLYNEELMNTKPLHYYRPTSDGWVIWKNVTTDLLGTCAGMMTSYGSGRVILYGPHPELLLTVNGTVHEFLGKGLSLYLPRFLQPTQYVFSYVGDMASYSNYWVIRRSVAYAGHVDTDSLPPVEETKIVCVRPWSIQHMVFFNDEQLFANLSTLVLMFPKNREKEHIPLIIGDITVIAYTLHCDESIIVDLCIDGEHIETLAPAWNDDQIKAIAYTKTIAQPLYGLHTVTFTATNDEGNRAWDSFDAFFVSP